VQNLFALNTGTGTGPQNQDTILAGARARGYLDAPADGSGKRPSASAGSERIKRKMDE
jgi:hypothetical protein